LREHSAYISKITDLENDLEKSLEFVDWKSVVKADSTIFLKPNFTFPNYREGITTSPNLLKKLLEIFKNRADRVIIGESDGGNRSFSADAALKGHNMYEICRDCGAELVNLSKEPYEFVEENILGKRVRVQLPKLLLNDIDCFVSVPVLKVHVMTGVTLSIKNLWGCYPNTMRGLYHKNLNYKLALMCKKLNPKLVVIDGTFALDGHGPMFGEVKRTDLILSSNNPVVADSLGSQIMGIPLKKANHILIAEKEGLGTTSLEKVNINADLELFKMKFHVNKTLMDNISWFLFNSEIIAKIAMDSPLTPLSYLLANRLKNKKEKKLTSEIDEFSEF
jgi:uncharacterized protein (DUF362 family)